MIVGTESHQFDIVGIWVKSDSLYESTVDPPEERLEDFYVRVNLIDETASVLQIF